MPASPALVARYGARYDTIRRQVATAIGLLWDRLGSVADLDPFATAAAALSAAAQSQTVALVAGYLAAYLDTAPVSVDAVEIRAGVDLADVYRRPGITARAALSGGQDFLDAMAKARVRAVSAATTDVALAHRAAATTLMGNDQRVVGYRRVLTGASCKLCATASTQRYRVDRLMPIHNHCDCRVAPIVGTEDPGHVINRRLLDRLKDAGPDYWRDHGFVDPDGNPVDPTEIGAVTDAVVREHGELGPVLTDGRDTFTGPADLR